MLLLSNQLQRKESTMELWMCLIPLLIMVGIVWGFGAIKEFKKFGKF